MELLSYDCYNSLSSEIMIGQYSIHVLRHKHKQTNKQTNKQWHQPKASAALLLLIAGRYSGDKRTLKSLSKGSHFMKACKPLVFKHSALSTLGSDDRTSRVAGIYKRLSNFTSAAAFSTDPLITKSFTEKHSGSSISS